MKSINKIILMVAMTAAVNLCQAQTPSFAWAKQLGGPTLLTGSTGYCVATDASGNVYSAGRFAGTIDFDPGTGVAELTAVASHDIFISKLDANGNFVWAKGIGSSSTEEAHGIAVDNNNNVYVTGFFQNTADFDGGPGVQNLTPIGGGPNNADIFILKLDADGNYQWAKNIGAPGSVSFDGGEGIAVTGAGDVFVSGHFSYTVDFDPGAGSASVASDGSSDGYVLKLDTNGNYVWVRTFHGVQPNHNTSIALDGSGNIYAGGIFRGTVDFDPGAGTSNITSAGNYDMYISKLDASGDLVWTKTMGGTMADELRSIAVDGAGNILFTGTFLGTSDFDPGSGTLTKTSSGSGDIVIGKLDTNGNANWAITIGGTNADIGESLAVDATGNVYATGYFYGAVDFDPGAGVHQLLTAGETDIFLLKLDPSGNYTWAGSMGYVSGEDDHGFGIGLSSTGDIYSVGNFNRTTDFDPGSCTFDLASVNRVAYVHKMSPSSAASHTITNFSPTSGAVGTLVTISGTNFNLTPANNIVEFNGTPSIVTASTATSITTTVPLGATTGPIKVTIGCDVVTGTNFTVLSGGTFSFTTQPSSKIICSGSNTTFTVSASGDTGLQYQWQIDNSGYSDLSNNATYTGVNTATLTISNALISLNGTKYRCVVSGDNTSNTPSNAATLTVNTTPSTPTIQPINLGCSPASTILIPSGASAGESYRFYDAVTNGNLLDDGSSFDTGSLNVMTTFYVSTYNTTSLCESARTPVTVTVVTCNPPIVQPNKVITMIEGIATINLTEIISDPDDNVDLTTIEITQQPISGAIATLDQLKITLDYSGLPNVTSDNLRIRVCDMTSICTESNVAIELTGELIVYNGISANDDTQNDSWQIVNIDLFTATKNNKVTVFNRWGDEVFKTTNYDNTSHVFKGRTNSGGELPSGTYYYKIEFTSGMKTLTGYLVLKR